MKFGEIRTLAATLIDDHLPGAGWMFDFDNAKKRVGCCKHGKKLITISRHLADQLSESEIRDVLLHEIAHALVGVSHGHNQVWKRKALEIGCNAQRCCHVDVSHLCDYHGECLDCKKTYSWTRKPKYPISGYICPHCKSHLTATTKENP